ncbi:HAD-IA family hydrolase [Roseovarius salis]|uniref:HAD-IA family hydrolase n=1 Tax=Roseovarius salis TaxID=3376063 RepID=UPI0037C5C92C
MTGPLRLIVFDVDGTLVDSQGDIVAAMAHAFSRAGQPAPPRGQVLGIVGLSLDTAMPRLAPALPPAVHARMVGWYKDAYVALRAKAGAAESSPLYPHVRDTLARLHGVPEYLLGVATGKSRRGLDKLLEGHTLGPFFATQQVSDHHPSKPHPAMLHAAISETGVAAADAVMVGDTTYDMEMAQAAGIPFIGVNWGYHPAATLTGAAAILDDMRDLPDVLDSLWEPAK